MTVGEDGECSGPPHGVPRTVLGGCLGVHTDEIGLGSVGQAHLLRGGGDGEGGALAVGEGLGAFGVGDVVDRSFIRLTEPSCPGGYLRWRLQYGPHVVIAADGVQGAPERHLYPAQILTADVRHRTADGDGVLGRP